MRWWKKGFASICFLAPLYVGAQLENNYVLIDPSDSPASIVAKAAHVVPSKRQLEWQKLELTAFIHFGMNTFMDKEWGDGKADPRQFNPAALDARQWVRVLKNAGFKQITLTAKHHDGFCLWPSAYTDYSVKSSPWKNGKGDVVKELSDACHAQGMRFGVYLSPWDRHSPFYGMGQVYDAYFEKQLTELLTNYGEVDEVWFDGANGEGPNGKKQVYNFAAYISLIRRLQPNAVIFGMGPDVRWIGTETGYGRNTEWSVVPSNAMNYDAIAANSQTDVAFAPQGNMMGDDLGSREKLYGAKGLVWYPAEADVSIRDGFFYHADQDATVKSPEKLFDIYLNSVGKNGVLLLNVPPDKQGLITASDIKSLNGFKTLMDATFEKDLAAGAKAVSFSKGNPSAMTDSNPDTYFSPDIENDTTAIMEIHLAKESSFDLLSLQEFIPDGQHVESWVLEYKEGNEWKEITKGTTIGYKRLVRFPLVTASTIRFKILSARSKPEISALGLYKLPIILSSPSCAE